MFENLIPLLFLLIFCFLIYLLFQEIKKQKRGHAKYRLDNRLSKKILLMLSGDKKAALRLLRNARQNNPHKSYLWCQEKVIRDLERDRRY
ncbi:MAG: hypothetical protein AB4372_10305 [Xenococcus sp. (in: cyanobacteria)]